MGLRLNSQVRALTSRLQECGRCVAAPMAAQGQLVRTETLGSRSVEIRIPTVTRLHARFDPGAAISVIVP